MEHPNVERIVPLRKIKAPKGLNDLPFRLLHIVAFFVFATLYFRYSPELDTAAGSLSSGALDELDGQYSEPPPPEEQTVSSGPDDLDSVILPADPSADGTPASNSTGDEYEIWEPKTPHDFALVGWVLLGIAHALVNLFCVWSVRVTVFCKFSQVADLARATHVLCLPAANHGTPAITELNSRVIVDKSGQQV